MAMKRTTVFAEEDDLAILKTAAIRRGVPEAELIRDAIHLAAMANRQWAEPFFSQTYAPTQSEAASPAEGLLDDVWNEKANAYEQSKDRAQ